MIFHFKHISNTASWLLSVYGISGGAPSLDNDVDYYIIIIKLLDPIFSIDRELKSPYQRSHWIHDFSSIRLPMQGYDINPDDDSGGCFWNIGV